MSGDEKRDRQPLKRRQILKVGFAGAMAGLTGISRSMAATIGITPTVDWSEIVAGVQGTVIPRNDSKFEIWRRSLVWQLRKPDRHPAAIVRAESVEDIIATVKFASDKNLQVAVRTGGHGYDASFLQDDVILLDIGALTATNIDVAGRTITLQPGVRSVDLMAMLAEKGLSFPAAHCGAVPMGGFLLGGGLGWNGEAWNAMSCFNILEVEVVTARGTLIVANEKQNQDYYWAARGAGPCFFGVITSYKLALFENPSSVLTSTYFWPLSAAERACAWANKMTAELPANVELIFIVAEAPDNMSTNCASNRKVGFLQATAFASTTAAARKLLEPLASKLGGLQSDCLMADEYAVTPVSALYEWDATNYPQWRWAVDSLWTDDPPERLVAAILKDIEATPSDKSSALMLFKPRSVELPDDAAFSMIGSTYFATYAIWGKPAEDDANVQWLNSVMKSAQPYTKGRYINESNYIAKPERIQNSFSNSAWTRLQSLIKKHDPEGRFYQVPS